MVSAAYVLGVFSDQLTPGSEFELPTGHSVVYIRAGTVTSVLDGASPITRQANEAWWSSGGTRLVGEDVTSWVDRWTLAPVSGLTEVASDLLGTTVPRDPSISRGAATLRRPVTASPDTRAIISREVALDGLDCVLRCDRVDFPPGAVAYLHMHAGPGIRRLISGSLRVETRGEVYDYRVGDCWFEDGPSPVYAAASADRGAAFVRVLVLPSSYKGKSSITYLRPEDRQRPKRQRYSIYVDDVVQL